MFHLHPPQPTVTKMLAYREKRVSYLLMKHGGLLFFLTLGLLAVLTINVQAQGSPYARPEDNVGSWSWDKPAAKNTDDDDSEERELGETSWERMQAEKAPAEEEPPRQEVLKSLSPLGLWEWWRKEKKVEGTESTEATESSSAEEREADESATEEE